MASTWEPCQRKSECGCTRCRNSSLPDAVAGSVHSVPPLDVPWMEATAKKAAFKLEKLDTDLKNYKSNSIKESIRWAGFNLE